MPHFFDEEKYVIHYENSQLYSRLALKVKKVHRVLQFTQSQWLKPFIEFSTKKRIEAEKALYTLINDAVYRKTMENSRNRTNVKLVNNEKRLFKMHNKTKLYATQNIWQLFSYDMKKQSFIKAQQTCIHWKVYSGIKYSINLRV